MSVTLQIATQEQAVPTEEDFKLWAQTALPQNCAAKQVTIRVVDEDESAHLNFTYRQKNGPTNVLSFPFLLPEEFDSDILGDLVMCAPVINREAEQQTKAAEAHWAHMTVHGILHLLGYDHLTDADAEKMEQTEIEILAKLNFSDPYHQGIDHD